MILKISIRAKAGVPNAPINVMPLGGGGRPGIDGGFDSSHRPVVGTFFTVLMAFVATFY